MEAYRVMRLANDPSVPRFLFGGSALEVWTRKHRDPNTGYCGHVGGSGWYLVKHQSFNPAQRPDFWTLNHWHYMQVTPYSVDVPHGVVSPSVAPILINADSEPAVQWLAQQGGEHVAR